MLQYATRRIFLSIPVLLAVLFITFTLGFYAPGDPLTMIFDEDTGEHVDLELLAILRNIHGLDRPFFVQFGDYIWDVARGDLGDSIHSKRSVASMIARGWPISAQIGGAAAVLLVAVSIPLGVLAAAKQNTWIDYWIVGTTIALKSVPVFVLGPILMIILVLKLNIMDTPVGWDGIWSVKAILPVFLMAAGGFNGIIRLTRSGVLEVMTQNYVRTARAKGLRELAVVNTHVIKNSMTPVLTTLGLTLSGLITGAVFVELIFAIPGLAGIGIDGFRSRDYPVIMATTLIGAVLIVFANLIVDVSYGFLDPRVRFS